MSHMFELGDRICSKRTGLPLLGNIVGILKADSFCIAFKIVPTNYHWTKFYTDWFDKYVYYVKSDQAQRIASFEEWVNGVDIDDPVARRVAEIGYQSTVGMTDMIWFPEDDLSLL